ncbi:MAG: hypothetical protein LUH14_03295 [Clostridiaceae bacterium]|nr:hypothetical protein [Clostridiaceae bacterium]
MEAEFEPMINGKLDEKITFGHLTKEIVDVFVDQEIVYGSEGLEIRWKFSE